jgi:hypothetical protein
MLRTLAFRPIRMASLTAVVLAFVNLGEAQVSGPPSANCHVVDGKFTACPNGKTEWSDVKPLAFPATNSYLYVNQDPEHTYLYLMYDFPFRTSAIGPAESVHVSFDTVSQDSGVPALEQYDIDIFGNGQIQVSEQGKPTPPGRIAGAAGFGISPNSATPHLIAELQVPLTPGPPTDYSPDPLFWSATVPPTPPPPPPPPTCPSFLACLKTPGQIAAWNQEADAAFTQAALILSTGTAACNRPLDQLEMLVEPVYTTLGALVAAAKAAVSRAALPTAQALALDNELIGVESAATEASTAALPPPGFQSSIQRGLAPGDAPTIQDEIAMIVEFRTIQNPAISGPALTTQLVNGLVNDGIIPPGQASSIEASVLQQLVTPAGQPTISGQVVSPTLHASTSVEVDVKLTDIGTGNAVSAALTQVTLRTLSGTGSVTVNSPALPLTIGNLAVGLSTTVKLFLHVPSTVKRFSITENGTVQDILNRPFNFSTSQQVIVH